MLPWDPQGKQGPKRPLPDHVSIVEPKEETIPDSPESQQKESKAAATASVVPAAVAVQPGYAAGSVVPS